MRRRFSQIFAWILSFGLVTSAFAGQSEASVHVVKGDTLRAEGRYDEAVQEYKEALRLKGEDFRPGQTVGSDGRRSAALATLTRNHRETIRLRLEQHDPSL